MTPQQQAASRRADGASYRTIAAELGVAEMTVYGWLNQEYRDRTNARHAEWKRNLGDGPSPTRQREIRKWAKRAVAAMTPHERKIVALALQPLDLGTTAQDIRPYRRAA